VDHDSYKCRKSKGKIAQISISEMVATTKTEIFNFQNICEASSFSLEMWRLSVLHLQPGKD